MSVNPGFAICPFGVRINFTAESEPFIHECRRRLVLPEWQVYPLQNADLHYHIETNCAGIAVFEDGRPLGPPLPDLSSALDSIDRVLHISIGSLAQDWVFVHAGVVLLNDRLMVLPASSFGGKSTLVQALLLAGATFYSDEVAAIDVHARIHPYPRPLKLRQTDLFPSGIGPRGAERSVIPRVPSVVLFTRYAAGASFEPRRLAVGPGVLQLMEHTIPIRLRPAQVMRTLIAACRGAECWEGPRGEVAETVPKLLALLR